MKLEFLTGYLNENHRNTGSLNIYYDFSGISGFFVPNRLYGNKTQFNQIVGGYTLNNQYSPGIFISCYKETGFTGSGIFEGVNTLKVSNSLSGDNLTFLYNFGALNCSKNFTIGSKNIKEPTGCIQVLTYIESKNQNNPFEIILGLNDAKKLTLEFSGSTGYQTEIYKSTNLSELAFQNMTSLKLNSNNIECSYLDIIEDEISDTLIYITGTYFNQEKNMYLGNIPTGKYRIGYTGFVGNIKDFVVFEDYFDSSLCLGLAKNLLKTGEEIQAIDITGVKYNIIKSGYLNPTGIIGVGITGYKIVQSSDVINSCNENCIIYVQSGVTGYITGEKIEYAIVNQEEYSVTKNYVKHNMHNENEACDYTKNYIVFTPALDSNDIYSINLYKDLNNKVENLNYSTLNKVYIAEDELFDKDRLILFNGLSIHSGSYIIEGNGKKFIIDSYDKDYNDLVIYSISDFSSLYKNIYYDATGDKSGDYILGSKLNAFSTETSFFLNPNVFLNGQKLISQYDYIYSLSGSFYNFYLNNKLDTGIISLVTDNYLINITGSNIKYFSPNISYNNERIWLNGVFQNKNENYILTSCLNTLLHSNKEVDIQNEIIFDDEYHRFVS